MSSKDVNITSNVAYCNGRHLVHALDQVVDEVLPVAMVTALNVVQPLLVHTSLNKHSVCYRTSNLYPFCTL